MKKSELLLKNNVRVARVSRHLSQQDLADLCGTSQVTISAIENEKWVPSVKLALILSVALNEPINYLFWLDVC